MSTRAARYAESRFYEKHRLGARNYSVDWATELSSGEALSGAPTVTVVTTAGVDVTSQFSVSNQATTDTRSTWTLGAATSTDQDAGKYYIRIQQDTDGSQTLQTVHALYVSELGDADAP